MAQNPNLLVKNANKLVAKIQSDLNKELQKKITALFKGMGKELNEMFKGKPVSSLGRINATNAMEQIAMAVVEDGFRLGDKRDVINSQTIKRVTWDGGLHANSNDILTTFTATTDHNDIIIECVINEIQLIPLNL